MFQNEEADYYVGFIQVESTIDIGNIVISRDNLKHIRADYVGHMAKMVRKRRRNNVSRKPVNVEPNIFDDQQQTCLTQKYKGLENL